MGRVERLAEEFPLEVEWRKIQIHPEIPPQGVSLERLAPQVQHYLNAVMQHVQAMAEPGIEFRQRRFLANSGLAIVGGEYAHRQGRFEPYMKAVFRAFFTESRNIGDPEQLAAIAETVGLDAEGLAQALTEERFHRQALERQRRAAQEGITGVPTFFIGEERVVGAQPYEAFRQAARAAQQEEQL